MTPKPVPDPYQVLGVSRSADAAEIKAAFRKAALKHHPDRNVGDPEAKSRFQEVASAYETLSDPERRRRYDVSGQEGARVAAGGSATYGAGFVSVEDLLGEIFGVSRARAAPSGRLQETVRLSFEEAALGCKKSHSYDRNDTCQACAGTGGAAGTDYRRCSACAGQGALLERVGMFGGVRKMPCGACAGRGEIPARACVECSGSGLTSRSRRIEVNVPPGIESGATQTIAGGGSRPAPNQPPADLELTIAVAPHARFKREGDDVLSVLEVPFTVAALGKEIQVNTLFGTLPFTVPAGAQHGEQLRFKGKGVPHRFRRGNGDHLFELRLVVPKLVGVRARELLLELGQLESELEQEGTWQRFKSLFQPR